MANNETVTTSLDNQTHNPDYVVGSSGEARQKGSYYNRYRKAKKRVLIGLGAVGTTAALGVATIFGIGVYRAVKSGEEFISSLDDGVDYVMETAGQALDRLFNEEPDYEAIAADANVRIRDLIKLEVLEGQVSGVTRALKDDPKGWFNKFNGQWEQGTGVGTIIGKVNLGDSEVAPSSGAEVEIENNSLKNIYVTHTGEGTMRITVAPEAIEYGLENFDIVNPIYYEQVFGKYQRIVPDMLGIVDERSLPLDGALRDYTEAELLHECAEVMDPKIPAAITNALTKLMAFLSDSGAKKVEVDIDDRLLPSDVDSNMLRQMALDNGYANPDQISAMIPEGGEGACVEVTDDKSVLPSPGVSERVEG